MTVEQCSLSSYPPNSVSDCTCYTLTRKDDMSTILLSEL